VPARAALALGLEPGIAFPQLIVADYGRVVVVECAARIPGGQMTDLVRHAVGVDLVDVQVRMALGEELPDELVTPRFRQPLAIRFLTAVPGPLSRAASPRRLLEKVLLHFRRSSRTYPVEGEGDPPVRLTATAAAT
jgi:hypothetical protein